VITKLLANQFSKENVIALIKLIPEYGRWDDLVALVDSNRSEEVLKIIADQLQEDTQNMIAKKPVSLLAKWLPSINTSSKDTKALARKVIKGLHISSERNYRKQVAALRKYIDVIEVKTSANKWGEIDYEKVPSQANIKYATAFNKHDPIRRAAFFEKLEKGEAKINSSTNYPHDIVHMLNQSDNWGRPTLSESPTAEALWKALPDYGLSNTLVVADGSGSMTSPIGNSNVTALEVANALAIYCAEHNRGEFKNKYITFSETPRFVKFNNDDTLYEKLMTANSYSEVANTNIKAVFDIILKAAIKNNVSQEEMVKNILVISDMEFDNATSGDTPDAKLFDIIKAEYKAASYSLPRLSFWNVNSRTLAIPVVENDAGVALVSGFSPTVIKMVMSDCLDPFEALKETLNGERYKDITWN
jgi:hypothetical protein